MSKFAQKDMTSILGFLKYQVSKRLFKAFKIISSPCCDVDVSDVDYTCVSLSGGNATLDITITLDRKINLLGLGTYVATWTISGRQYSFSGNFGDEDTITLDNAVLPNNSTATVAVTLFMPSNYTGDVGAFMKTASFSANTPNCV